MNEEIYLSVIIPAKNEEKRIIPTLKDIDRYLEKQPFNYEIIVVANNCTDKTVFVVDELKKEIENLKIIDLGAGCEGKGAAVKEGVKLADGKFIMFMDADNATRINELDKFWQWFEKGYDIVIGSRHIKGAKIVIAQPWYRQLLGRAANLLIQAVLLPGISDTQCGFKVFKKEVAKKLFSLSKIGGWGFDIEILALARKFGYKIKEAPVNWYEAGKSRLRPIKAAIRTLKELFKIKYWILTNKYKI